jgi:ribosome-associated protein
MAEAPLFDLPEAELSWRFTPSGGPGGQHANRSSTRAEVTWDVKASTSITEDQRRVLLERLGPVVTVAADDERSQKRNRDLARNRLARRIGGALVEDKPRRPTRPTKGSQRRRLDEKRRRSMVKKQRDRPSRDD